MPLNAKIRNSQSLEYPDGDLAPSLETINAALFWANACRHLGIEPDAEPAGMDSIVVTGKKGEYEIRVEISRGIPQKADIALSGKHIDSMRQFDAVELMDALIGVSRGEKQ